MTIERQDSAIRVSDKGLCGREGIMSGKAEGNIMYVGVWIWYLLGVCAIVIMALCGKILLMRKAAYEMREGIACRLKTDTNTLLDIASRDKAMRALAESLNEELRTLRSQRQTYYRGNLALKEAVTDISHDIRTPLTAIRGYLELLEGEEKTENTKRYLSVISERTLVLSQLTEELFLYAIDAPAGSLKAAGDGIGAGDVRKRTAEEGGDSSSDTQLKTEVVNMGKLIEESVLASYGALVKSGINPDIQLTEEKVKCRINANAAHRIIENILNNAIKYSDGDLHITLSEQGEVVFANHAASLDAVQTGRLFDRFYTVENARTSTGLGLSIARQLTERMGGSITARYEDGMLYLKLRFPTVEE